MYLFKYILKRIVLMLFTFLVIITMCFIFIKLLPNIPAEQFGKDMALILQRRELLGYNLPIMQQYARFWKYAFQGYFGTSEVLYLGQDVWSVFVQKLPFTVAVNVYSILFSIPLGLVLGIVAALKKNTWIDHLISTSVMIVVSVPSFIYAFLVQYILYFKLGWSSATMNATQGAFSWVGFTSMIPAVLSMSFGTIAGFARYTRAELTEVLTSEFMLLARTKGLTKGQATVRHAMRNAMVPIFPMILGEFISIMSGSLIIEQMFSIPGVGKLYVSSIQATPPDYNFFMLLSGFYTLIGLVAGIVIDISYSIIDPRIRMGAK
ncbi:MAG: ABC transporter permease [Erysipelotrichia bacterium]|nr:ABC transporter permease [Erysipelotrichia bacterium]